MQVILLLSDALVEEVVVKFVISKEDFNPVLLNLFTSKFFTIIPCSHWIINWKQVICVHTSAPLKYFKTLHKFSQEPSLLKREQV